MSRFRYKALTSGGEVREGIQEGASQTMVFRDLRRQGWWPVTAVELRRRDQEKGGLTAGPRFAAKDLAAFFHELAILIGSGVPLDRALALLSVRKGLRTVSKASANLLVRVRDGSSLAQALAADRSFPRLSVGLVRAGEASGTLEAELFRLSDIMTRTAAIRTEIFSALIYPAVLLVTAALAIGIIMVFVVPEFVPLFDDSGRIPPLAFRFLIAASHVVSNWGWVVVLTGTTAVFVIKNQLKTLTFRRKWDRTRLRTPLLGSLFREIETGRFCRTLGTLVKADVALPNAVSLAADAVGNSAMSLALGGVAKGLREGGRLADRLAATHQLAPDVPGLLRIGEESGRLGDMLLRQADLSDNNMRTQIARLLSIMVPAITLILGIVVAGIVTSLLVAILSINDLATR